MHASEEKFYSAIIIAAIVLGVIILFFVYNMIRHQRRNVQLYKAKIKAEISILENERKRIATDLHDELGPLLSAVRIHVNRIESLSENDKEIVAYANRHIDDIIQKTRAISYNLLPNTLVRKGVVKAVQEYINKLNDSNDITINFQYDKDFRLATEREVNIYRIIQEVIHNTVKHADASKLNINFKHQGDSVVLITADNGSGFDIEDVINKTDGIGLMSLQSRTEVLNSRFNYESEKGKGTTYIFEIPLDKQA